MKYRNTMIVLGSALFLGLAAPAMAAQDDETESIARDAQRQAELETKYERAILLADQERLAAEESLVKAREQLKKVAEQREEVSEKSRRASVAEQAEMAEMHEELNQVRRQLQETSREIARVNREVSRARSDRHATSYSYTISDRPVIGVILGETDDVGVKVLGVSPDGPSERAGIQQGDVIVAIGGRVLASIEESGNARDGLAVAMHDIKADEPLIVSVERDDQTLDLTLIPEIREPLTWQTVTRFPSAPTAPATVTVTTTPASPAAPGQVITIERIEVPEIDTLGMTKQIERMRVEIDERRALREVHRVAPVDGEFEFEFHELSELGNIALQDANVWFGLPVAQGLQLAEVDSDLGEYFKTDRGVLVLKAKQDNDLQLQTGDVILQVGETAVNSPADFMRALRGFDSGEEFEMEIKRNRKNRTLKTVIPENRTSFFNFEDANSYTFKVTTQ